MSFEPPTKKVKTSTDASSLAVSGGGIHFTPGNAAVLGGKTSSSITAIDVFVFYGFSFFHPDELFPTIAQTSRTWHIQAMRSLYAYCKRRHPGLVAACSAESHFISYRRFKRFIMDPEASRESGNLWTGLTRPDIGKDGDIDVIFELSRGEEVIGSSVAPFDALGRCDDEPECKFSIPNFSFMAPLPDSADGFAKHDPNFPGYPAFPFWCGGDDCSDQQKAIVKTLYGGSWLGKRHLKLPNETPLHVRLVMRRRSTGAMVTIMSTSTPNQIIGEDYHSPIGGEYVAAYTESISIPRTTPGEDWEDENNVLFSFGLHLGFWCEEKLPVGAREIEMRSFRKEEERTRQNTCSPCMDLQIVDGNIDSEATLKLMKTFRWA